MLQGRERAVAKRGEALGVMHLCDVVCVSTCSAATRLCCFNTDMHWKRIVQQLQWWVLAITASNVLSLDEDLRDSAAFGLVHE